MANKHSVLTSVLEVHSKDPAAAVRVTKNLAESRAVFDMLIEHYGQDEKFRAVMIYSLVNAHVEEDKMAAEKKAVEPAKKGAPKLFSDLVGMVVEVTKGLREDIYRGSFWKIESINGPEKFVVKITEVRDADGARKPEAKARHFRATTHQLQSLVAAQQATLTADIRGTVIRETIKVKLAK